MITQDKQKLKDFKKRITTELYLKKHNDNHKIENLSVELGGERYDKNKKRLQRDLPSALHPVNTIFKEAFPRCLKALNEKIEFDLARPKKKPKYCKHLGGMSAEDMVFQALSDAMRIARTKKPRPVQAAISIGQVIIVAGHAKAFEVRQGKQFKRLYNKAKKKYSNPERRMNHLLYLLKSATKNDKLHLDENDNPILDDDGNVQRKSALYGHQELLLACNDMMNIKQPIEERYDAEIGMPILQVIIDNSKIFQVDKILGSRKSTAAEKKKTGKDRQPTEENILTITDEAHDELLKLEEQEKWMKPRYMPMLVKPRVLGLNRFYTTGYHTADVQRTLQPVKKMKRLQKDAIYKSLDEKNMNEYWEGETNIQNVSWMVDNEIWYDVIIPDVNNNRKAGDKFPHIFQKRVMSQYEFALDKKLPPPKYWKDKHQKLFSRYKNDIEKYNRVAKANAVIFSIDCKTADGLKDYVFHLPVQPCARSRSYYVPFFNPQREDRMGAAFRFGEYKALGKDGIISIAAHLANCSGFEIGENTFDIPPTTKVDKVATEYKVWWVGKNWHWIHDFVSDFAKESHLTKPIDENKDWRKTDKPYHFLQAAREMFKAYQFQSEGGKLEDFKTNLPCALDSSSSGIQIYACLLHSYPDAVISNLVYKEGQKYANDVYQMMADAVTILIDNDIASLTKKTKLKEEDIQILNYAKIWKAFGIGRKVVKRPIMTSLYSATIGGHTIMIKEDTIDPQTFRVIEDEISENPFGDSEQHYSLASYLARKIDVAIEKQLDAPRKGMRVLQQLAQVMAEQGTFVEYTTPTGFPFINEVYVEDSVVADLYLTDAKLTTIRKQPTIVFDTDEIDVRKCVSKICPNFVHSLDASLMMLAVNAFVKLGGTHILTNHDAFATHACDIPILKSLLLDTRIAMFSKNRPLKDILEKNKSRINDLENYPEVPADGDFNLTEELPSAEFADS